MLNLEDIINLRHTLHRYPELSNQEFETRRRISDFMQRFEPDKEIDVAGTGKMFVFEGEEPGETIFFRCELDALPIQEKSPNLAYRSSKDGVAHLCGHDGHMAILVLLAKLISEHRPKKGKVVLLFQPAEEHDLGAKHVVESPEFHQLSPDYLFALHNLPGIPKNTVMVKEGSFSAASCGFTVKLEGRTAHAAEPEKGLNPYKTATRIFDRIERLTVSGKHFESRTISTLIYIHLGEIAFGVSPSDLEMGITLRAYENKDLEKLCALAEEIVEEEALLAKLHYSHSYCEEYPATDNAPECVEMIQEATETLDMQSLPMEEPNKWSEDFAYYTATNKGAQFGIGSGEDQPNLHHPAYDFPDDIIEPSARLFFEIYKNRLT
ncbi:amidohydrolase [Gracilimonas mengyeensis]|uniref:Amidohydrolase n=1 Tax=Gracilimonas mengyeensis TaxID=1302730 RepID=A0A521FLT5_9BACT|nr:amidohydrolase [Gracilimonas mengyeensis]SMO97168.1 amidohydrolase [Gracilimonas mengyeensis]